MNISAIKAYQPNFKASTAVATTKAPEKKQIDAKKVAITAVGLTAAGLVAWAVINKIKKGKANEVVEGATEAIEQKLKPVQETVVERAQTAVTSLAEIPVKKGEKFDASKYSEGQKLAGLINTAKMEGQIAEVEARLAKHDELQKMYEEVFATVEEASQKANK